MAKLGSVDKQLFLSSETPLKKMSLCRDSSDLNVAAVCHRLDILWKPTVLVHVLMRRWLSGPIY